MLKMLLCSAIMMGMSIVCISVACLVCAVVGATHHLKYSDRSIGIAMLTKEPHMSVSVTLLCSEGLPKN